MKRYFRVQWVWRKDYISKGRYSQVSLNIWRAESASDAECKTLELYGVGQINIAHTEEVDEKGNALDAARS